MDRSVRQLSNGNKVVTHQTSYTNTARVPHVRRGQCAGEEQRKSGLCRPLLQQSKPDPIQGTAGVYGTLGKPSPKNWPGSRSYSVTWQDAHGNIWLFGGFAFDSGARLAPMNDLGELNPSTREWTWMSGSGTLLPGLVGEAGLYGTKGQASPKNVPGSRADSIGWIDKQGNLWLFGGFLEQLDTGSPALCSASAVQVLQV